MEQNELKQMRRLPMFIFIISSIVFYSIGLFFSSYSIFTSLAEINFTISAFLVLVYQFNGTYRDLEEQAEDEEETSEIEENIEEVDPEEITQRVNVEINIAEILFGLCFVGISFWRLHRGLFLYPRRFLVSSVHTYIDVVIILLFLIGHVVYLKLRETDEGEYQGDLLSKFFVGINSSVFASYLLVISTALIFRINTIFILPWLLFAHTLYVVINIGFNMVCAFLQGEMLSTFSVILLPIRRTARGSNGADERQEAGEIRAQGETKERQETDEEEKAPRLRLSVKSLYTLSFVWKMLPLAVFSLILLLFVSTSIFIIQPYEEGVLYRFGQVQRAFILPAGLHVKYPWPIDQIEIYEVARVQSMQIGFESQHTFNNLWTQTHNSENLLLIGNGNELVAINMVVSYTISDLFNYVTKFADAQNILGAKAYQILIDKTVNRTLDELLSVDRVSLSNEIKEELIAFVAERELGIQVEHILIEGIHPPAQVATVYQSVVTASIDKNTIILNAMAEADRLVIEAQMLSQEGINEAMARQHDRVSLATRDTSVLYASKMAYALSPASFKLIRFLETYQNIIKNNKIYVFSDGVEQELSSLIIGKGTVTPIRSRINE